MNNALLEIFLPGGRVRRSHFAAMLVLLQANGLFVAWAGHTIAAEPPSTLPTMALIALALVGVVAVYLSFCNMIQRLHDVGASGLWSLLTLVPVVNVVLHLALLFMNGTRGENRFGSDPRVFMDDASMAGEPVLPERNDIVYCRIVGRSTLCGGDVHEHHVRVNGRDAVFVHQIHPDRYLVENRPGQRVHCRDVDTCLRILAQAP